MGKYLIGLDEGTTGCKACIFDFDGNLIGQDYKEYGIITYPDHPGWVEQDGEAITEALYACVKDAIKKSGVDKEDIEAIGFSTQGSVIGLADENGKLIYNWIGWQDLRAYSLGEEFTKVLDPEVSKAEFNTVPSLMSSAAKFYWLKKNEPELLEKAARYVSMQEYYLRSFGVKDFVLDAASVARESMANLEQHNYSQKIYDQIGIDITKRGRRVDNGYVAGIIDEEYSEKTGLPVGCKVCVGGMDQCCSPFGCGVYKDGQVAIIMGTFGSCFVCSDELKRIPNSTLTWKSHMYFEDGPKNWTAEAMSFASASAYRWFRDVICTKEIADAEAEGKDAYEIINEEIASSVPGAHGITFLPYLQGKANNHAGESRVPFRATFTGMSMATVRADLCRAVAEGILYEMKDIISIIREHDMKPDNVRVTGGITKSPMWCQMAADILEMPVTILETSENGCLGAAVFAGIGAGVYKDAEEGVNRAVRVKEVYEPNFDNKAAYDEGFERFVTLYKKLERPLD